MLPALGAADSTTNLRGGVSADSQHLTRRRSRLPQGISKVSLPTTQRRLFRLPVQKLRRTNAIGLVGLNIVQTYL